MSNATQAWFVGQRAENFAVAFLTRRSELSVERHEESTLPSFWIDYLVRGHSRGRFFGVEVQGTESLPRKRNGSGSHVLRLSNGGYERFRVAPFPICLFVFHIDDGSGFYRWIREPVVTAGAVSTLKFVDSSEFNELDEGAMDGILERIATWYGRGNP